MNLLSKHQYHIIRMIYSTFRCFFNCPYKKVKTDKKQHFLYQAVYRESKTTKSRRPICTWQSTRSSSWQNSVWKSFGLHWKWKRTGCQTCGRRWPCWWKGLLYSTNHLYWCNWRNENLERRNLWTSSCSSKGKVFKKTWFYVRFMILFSTDIVSNFDI